MKTKQIVSIFLFVVVTLLCGKISAQSMKADTLLKQMNEKLKTQLSLSEEQYAKLQTINKKFTQDLTALENSQSSNITKLKALKKLGAEREANIKTFLTDEQKAKFDKVKGKNREEFQKNWDARKK